MDKIELRVIAATGVLLSVFLMSVLYAATVRKIDVPDCVPYSGTFKTAQVKHVDSNVYEGFFVAKMWTFEPSEVYLPVGSDLDIYLTSQDVVHGFHIEKKGINLMAVPGAITKQTVRFDEPGVYKIVCHEYCGTGHQNMETEIIVNYPLK
jgi:cytochrome c oxidase subunit 2